MDYVKLRALIETHPTHAITSDEDMTIWLNDPTGVTRNQTTLPAEDIRDIVLTDTTEWLALTEPARSTMNMILGVGGSIPVESGTPTREAMQDILGTQTKIALGAALPEQVSRAVDDGFSGRIREGDVTVARTA